MIIFSLSLIFFFIILKVIGDKVPYTFIKELLLLAGLISCGIDQSYLNNIPYLLGAYGLVKNKKTLVVDLVMFSSFWASSLFLIDYHSLIALSALVVLILRNNTAIRTNTMFLVLILISQNLEGTWQFFFSLAGIFMLLIDPTKKNDTSFYASIISFVVYLIEPIQINHQVSVAMFVLSTILFIQFSHRERLERNLLLYLAIPMLLFFKEDFATIVVVIYLINIVVLELLLKLVKLRMEYFSSINVCSHRFLLVNTSLLLPMMVFESKLILMIFITSVSYKVISTTNIYKDNISQKDVLLYISSLLIMFLLSWPFGNYANTFYGYSLLYSMTVEVNILVYALFTLVPILFISFVCFLYGKIPVIIEKIFFKSGFYADISTVAMFNNLESLSETKVSVRSGEKERNTKKAVYFIDEHFVSIMTLFSIVLFIIMLVYRL